MRGDDGGDDRQAEAGARAAALAAGLRSPEALEQLGGVARRAGRGRGRGPPARASEAAPSTRTSIGVPGAACARVRCASGWPATLRSSSRSPSTMTGPSASRRSRGRAPRRGRRRPRRAPQRAARRARARASRTSSRRASTQQVLDEHAHAGGLLLDAAHRLLGVRRVARARRAGRARRSRGSTTSGVRSSCEASARKRRSRSSLRLALGERGLDLAEHAVEREAQAADLGLSVAGLTRRERSPPAIAPAVAPMRSSGPQAEAHDQPRQQRQRKQDDGSPPGTRRAAADAGSG